MKGNQEKVTNIEKYMSEDDLYLVIEKKMVELKRLVDQLEKLVKGGKNSI